MSLSRPRLQLLCRVAEKKEADGQRELGDAQRKLAGQQETERELRGYLAEYEAQPLGAATPALLENRRQFLLRLRSAVEAQHQQVIKAAAQVEQARLKWIALHNELRIAETMLEQGCAIERRSEERKAQREMDEFALTHRPTAACAH